MVVIFEVTSIWRLHDDSEVKINACSIFTLVDGRFTDRRITSTTPPSVPFSANQGAHDKVPSSPTNALHAAA